MRRIYALPLIALIAGACAQSHEADEAVSESTGSNVISDETEGTLEINPPKSSPAVVPPTTAADPVGGTESLFPGQFEPGLDPFVELAVADLAQRLGVTEASIVPVSSSLVIWPDTSMGCPLPGMQYAQVLQDGSLIELESAGLVYRYHTGGDRVTPFLCDQPLATPPVTGDATSD